MKLGFQKLVSDAAVFYRHGTRSHAIIAMAVYILNITAAKQSTLDGIREKLKEIN